MLLTESAVTLGDLAVYYAEIAHRTVICIIRGKVIHLIEQPRQCFLDGTVFALNPLCQNNIISFLRLVIQLLYFLGTVLKITVHNHDPITGCIFKSCKYSLHLSEIT